MEERVKFDPKGGMFRIEYSFVEDPNKLPESQQKKLPELQQNKVPSNRDQVTRIAEKQKRELSQEGLT